MSSESGNKIVGGIILLGIIVVLGSLIGAFLALEQEQFLGAGVLMLAASLPITVAAYSIFGRK